MQNIEMKPNEITKLPLNMIDFDPDQPRKTIPDGYIEEMAADIKSKGVLQAITVRPNEEEPGRFIIVYGECRYRGSKLANKRQIPAVLDQTNKTELERMISQVKENYHRRNLNVIEIAGFLKRLRDEFGMKSQKKMEDTLKQHGMNTMSRSYIANTIRLLELPDWAQDLISTEALTAAHGKYLLSAKCSDSVMTALQKVIEENPGITTRELQDEIFHAFADQHQRLNLHWITNFDYKEQCINAGCVKNHKINTDGDPDYFCLDTACYEAKKQACFEHDDTDDDHDIENEFPIAEPKPDDNGVVDTQNQALEEDYDYRLIEDAIFETQDCVGCAHCFQVKTGDEDTEEVNLKEACFNLNCWGNKQDEYHDIQTKLRVCKESIMSSAEATIAATIEQKPELLNALTSWVLCGKPAIDTDDNEPSFNDWLDSHTDAEDQLIERGAVSLEAFINNPATLYTDVTCRQIAANLGPVEIGLMVDALNIEPESYRVNDDYLRNMTEAELLALLIETGIIDDEIIADYEKKELPELYQLCIDSADQMTVPGDIEKAWSAIFKKPE